MSLKDEIEKIIQAEQQKLEAQDHKHKEYDERQKQRFRPLRTLLEEFASSIEDKYIKARIYDHSATIEVGDERDKFKPINWEIQPNYDIRFHAEKGESLFYEKAGFRVNETIFYEEPDFHFHEKEHIFETESNTIEYLVKATAEQIATFRHSESIRKQIEGDSPSEKE